MIVGAVGGGAGGEYPYLQPYGKEDVVDVAARMTSKGQVTVPKAVREALGLEAGDEVLFRVEAGTAVMSRTADFLDLAGTVQPPDGAEPLAWDEIRERAWAEAAGERERRALRGR